MRPHVLGRVGVDRSTGRDGAARRPTGRPPAGHDRDRRTAAADRGGASDGPGNPDRSPARSPTLGAGEAAPSTTSFEVVPTALRHAAATYDVLQRANGHPVDAERRARHVVHIAEQLERFPEGQFVAVVREAGVERVVGTSATMRTRRPPDAPPLPWRTVIGDYGLPNHDPGGEWLYGVEIAVDPDFQRRGIASALYRVRLALVGELGLRGWYAGGMLMGYHRYADVLAPRAYAERVLAGEIADPTVTMQLRRGLRPAGIIEGYDPEPKAGGCAVLLVWTPPQAAPPPAAGATGAGGRARTGGREAVRPA